MKVSHNLDSLSNCWCWIPIECHSFWHIPKFLPVFWSQQQAHFPPHCQSESHQVNMEKFEPIWSQCPGRFFGHTQRQRERERERPLHFKHFLLVEKAEPVQVHFTLCLRDQRSIWMQDGCKVYMDSYTAFNGSCFMVTWTTFKNHLLEVGLTQNQETMALQTLTTVDLFYFIMCEDSAWIEIPWDGIWLMVGSRMTSHYTRGSVTTIHDFGGVLEQRLDMFLWALTISWLRLLARVWIGPSFGRGSNMSWKTEIG